MKILLLSRYGRLGASSRVRFYQYLPYLAEQGVEVTTAPLLDDRYVVELYRNGRKLSGELLRGCVRRLRWLPEVGKYDLVWLEGELFPWAPAWIEGIVARAGVPLVVDYDDAIFHRYDRHSNPVVRALLGRKIDRVMRGATVVLAGNDYLIERARRAGAARVEYVPSVVDVRSYPAKKGRCGTKPFTVGWIGSPATAPYLTELFPALESAAAGAQMRLLSVGSGPLPPTSFPQEVLPWSEEREAAMIREFDVGVMPLSDGPWERGKCGYKLIQYMASGLPVVASAVGANRQIVEHGVDGFLVRNPVEWTAALARLQRDPELRLRMGLAGRSKVAREYSVQAMAPRLLQVLRSVIVREERATGGLLQPLESERMQCG